MTAHSPKDLSVLDPRSVRDTIRTIRASTGLSQAKFAPLVGLTRDQIAQYEIGRSMPRADDYLKILTVAAQYHKNCVRETLKT